MIVQECKRHRPMGQREPRRRCHRDSYQILEAGEQIVVPDSADGIAFLSGLNNVGKGSFICFHQSLDEDLLHISRKPL